ncbi:LysR family transcriptional regulator [Nonomuraea sp. K274]|uniref:LysR family transcriptional regulator n=1 Tax=Nonomuraea cypriaca TaxID=1187855 RepID=A0A931AI23_9ACTN|nr:LysR family transcriptional regulator [Nonomuraea cypriaca]MBF8191424.1 LysR family transcriptional regulator [Nonomuraea cypriaca]
MDLQVSWLATFVAVVDHGSFTAAGRALGRSQPRVSAHVAALERALGGTLLTRTSKEVTLTAAGARFLPKARAALAEIQAGADEVRTLRTKLKGHVTVGGYPGLSAVLLAPLMQQFRRLHPGVTVVLREGDPLQLEEAIAHGEMDIALRTSDVPQVHHNVPSAHLFHEKIVLVVPKRHPLATASPVDLELLADETVMVTGDPYGGWADYRDRLDCIGADPAEIIVIAQPTTISALVAAGLGVAIMGAFAAQVAVSGEKVVTRPLPAPLWQREIRLYRKAGRVSTKPVDAFVDLLHQQAPSLTPHTVAW